MNLEDLKDQIKERVSTVWAEIQDSSFFNTLRERYDTLPGHTQKLIIFGSAALIFLLIFSIPLSNLQNAANHMNEFETKRRLARELLKASRTGGERKTALSGMNAASLRSRVERKMENFNLVDEQKGTVSVYNPQTENGLVPPSVEQAGVAVELKNLNLDQIINIGYQFGRLHRSVKLIGLEILPSEEEDKDQYYNVTFRLVSYSLSSSDVATTDSGKGPEG